MPLRSANEDGIYPRFDGRAMPLTGCGPITPESCNCTTWDWFSAQMHLKNHEK